MAHLARKRRTKTTGCRPFPSARNAFANLLADLGLSSTRSLTRPSTGPRLRSYRPRTETLEARNLLAFGPIDLVSVSSDGNSTGNAQTTDVGQLSDDGRYHAFLSSATDLIEFDNNNAVDLFIRDLQTGNTQVVTRGSGGGTAFAINSEIALGEPEFAISGDGSYVAFTSGNRDLSSDYMGTAASDVYRFNRELGSIELVSIATDNFEDPFQGGNGDSTSPAISFDGAQIAFTSDATDLTFFFDENGDAGDVFVRDLNLGQTTLVSGYNGEFGGDGDSRNPQITSDGSKVFFETDSQFLVDGVDDFNEQPDLLVHSIDTGINEYVSLTDQGNFSAGRDLESTPGSLSADGRYLVFETDSTELSFQSFGSISVFLKDFVTGEVSLISRNGSGRAVNGENAVISADGRYVAFESRASDLPFQETASNFSTQIVRWDRINDTYELLTTNFQGTDGGDGGSTNPQISGDGTRIAFTSSAKDLVDAEFAVGFSYQAFVWDQTDGTRLVSHVADQPAVASQGSARDVRLSRDGRRVFFVSQDGTLEPGHTLTGSQSNLVLHEIDQSTNRYVSRRLGVSIQSGDEASFRGQTSLSADGRYQVFRSASDNFVQGPTFGTQQVFVRDNETGEVTHVSRATEGILPGANADSFSASISDDGRYVVFSSRATNLDVTGPTGSGLQVYRYDRVDDVLITVSLNAEGDAGGNNSSFIPTISGDGNLVGFVTFANNLVDGVSTGTNRDAIVRDIAAGVTYVLSLDADDPTIGGDGTSNAPVFSRDGSTAIYYSQASNLQTGVSSTDTIGNAVRHVIGQNTNQYLSIAEVDGQLQTVGADDFAVSDDGNAVAFTSTGAGIVGVADRNAENQVYIYDAIADTTSLVTANDDGEEANGPSFDIDISGDGRYVVFESFSDELVSGDTNSNWDIFAYDRQSAQHTLVSINAAGTGPSDSYTADPTISRDGSVITFVARSGFGLTAATGSEFDQIYTRDWLTDSPTTQLVSQSKTAGTPGNNRSVSAELSDDGSTIAFSSQATNLLNRLQDLNGTAFDVYVFRDEQLELASASPLDPTRVLGLVGSYDIDDTGSVVVFSIPETDDFQASSTTALVNLIDTEESQEYQVFVPRFLFQAAVPAISGDGSTVVFNQYDYELETFGGLIASGFRIADIDTGTLRSTRSSPFRLVDGEALRGRPQLSSNGDTLVYESLISTSGLSVSELGEVGNRLAISSLDLTDPEADPVWFTRVASSRTNARSIFRQAQVSDDGSRIVFESNSGELIEDRIDRNEFDLFAFAGGEVTSVVLVDRDSDVAVGITTTEANDYEISNDGSRVLFHQINEGVTAGRSSRGESAAFIRDLESGRTMLAAINDDNSVSGNSILDVTLSGDGKTVAYIDDRFNNGVGQLLVRDLEANITTAIEPSDLSFGNLDDFSDPALSGDGETVSFLHQGDLRVASVSNDPLFARLVASGVQNSSVSGNGSTIAFVSFANNLTTQTDANRLPGIGLSGADLFVARNSGVTVIDASVTEADDGETTLSFTVRLVQPMPETVTVDFETVEETAVAGQDFIATSGTLEFPPGETNRQVVVTILNDNVAENQESFSLLLSGVTAADVIRSSAVGVIVDDDVVLSIDSASIVEGNAGNRQLVFPVTLSEPSDEAVSVTFNTVPTSGISGTTLDIDFTSVSGSIEFAAGETSATITVPVLTDQISEPDETLRVLLSDATGATLGRSVAIGTIENDDAQISVDTITRDEGNEDETRVSLGVRLLHPVVQEVTFDYETVNGTATSEDSDYVFANGQGSIFAGGTRSFFSVHIVGDNRFESDEMFEFSLSNIVGALTDSVSGIVTIINDDEPTGSLFDVVGVTVREGEIGEGVVADVIVSLDPAPIEPTTITLQTESGSATAGEDFVDTTVTVSFDVGQTQQTVSIPIIGDDLFEPTEAFDVVLSDPSSGTINNQRGEVRINDDDVGVNIVAGEPVIEGDDGTTVVVVTLQLEAVATVPATFLVSTIDAAATAGSDYAEITDQTVLIAVGERIATIEIPITGDTDSESDESFFLEITNTDGASILGDGRGEITIVDDDVQYLINDLSVSETDAIEDLQFIIRLDRTLTVETSVRYTTVADTAGTDTDFQATQGVAIFAPGEDEFVVSIPIIGDDVTETTERLFVELSDPRFGFSPEPTATILVIDDDENLISPTVIGFRVQQDTDSRAIVNTFSIQFDQELNVQSLIDDGSITDAVSLIDLGVDIEADADVPVELLAEQFSYDAGVLTWNLPPNGTRATSLPDGLYQLTLDGEAILGSGGQRLDGDTDGQPGGDFVTTFHRLAADTDGNAIVDSDDVDLVNENLGRRVGFADYDSNADLDGDGRITARDRLIVARSRNRSITSPTPVAASTSRFDATADGQITALDALVVVNQLARQYASVEGEFTSVMDSSLAALDVNRDGRISSLDALQIVNEIAARNRPIEESEGLGSGEQTADATFVTADSTIDAFKVNDQDEDEFLLTMLAEDQRLLAKF